VQALERLGDIASLRGDLDWANERYEAARGAAEAEQDRRRIHAADIGAVLEAAGRGPVTAIGISKSGNMLVLPCRPAGGRPRAGDAPPRRHRGQRVGHG
jgi:hypothetical protein